MSFYDEIRIINCELTTIPASAFANFGSVNHFSFTGGNLDNIHQDALLGLNVFRDNSLPTPRGSFQMIDVDLVPGGLPTGLSVCVTLGQLGFLCLTFSVCYDIPYMRMRLCRICI